MNAEPQFHDTPVLEELCTWCVMPLPAGTTRLGPAAPNVCADGELGRRPKLRPDELLEVVWGREEVDGEDAEVDAEPTESQEGIGGGTVCCALGRGKNMARGLSLPVGDRSSGMERTCKKGHNTARS